MSGHMKAEVVWLGRHWRPHERPHLSPGWKCAGWGALPAHLFEGWWVVCQAAHKAVPAINQFGKGHLLWDPEWLSGYPGGHSALAPLRPPCSEGGKAPGLLPALGRGRQQSAAVMATEC